MEIYGNKLLSEQYIKQTASTNNSTNIFAFNRGTAKKNLLKNNYVDGIEIKKDYFAKKITLTIHERILSGYIEHSSGSFVYIDENGRVLEVNSYYTEKLPIVVGLKLSEITVGEVLNVSNTVCFGSLVVLARLFNKYGLESDVIKVDVSDENNIHLFINNINIEFGDIKDADQKIRTIIEIVKKLKEEIFQSLGDENIGGFLDIKDITKPARFRPLT